MSSAVLKVDFNDGSMDADRPLDNLDPSPDYSLDKWAGRLVLGARSRRHDASAAVFLQ